MFTRPCDHTMGNALRRYLEIKVHHHLQEADDFETVVVQGCYDRSTGISKHEKNDKPFNFKRPTATISGDHKTVFINCFPGVDYVRHYTQIIGAYFQNYRPEIRATVKCVVPSATAGLNTILATELSQLPRKDLVIVGNVAQIHAITNHAPFTENEEFCWSEGCVGNKQIALLGCRFSFWGDIAGSLATALAKFGHANVVYVGKVGGLQQFHDPNNCLATGSTSTVVQQAIHWKNLFQNVTKNEVHHGAHITSFSILQETKAWLARHGTFDFVDPEIGHMAACAQQARIGFSYLHVISNNLTAECEQNLSNERKPVIRKNRDRMFNLIASTITETLENGPDRKIFAVCSNGAQLLKKEF